MRRSLTTAVAVLTVATLAAVPSQAAVKKKPKPIKGSYTLQLPPDPTPNVFINAPGAPDGCLGVLPVSIDNHPFTVPAAGTLKVVLDSVSPIPDNPAGPDWDLWLYDSSGFLAGSHSATDHEEVVLKFKKKTPVTFQVCNLTGTPDATVSYTFTYR